MRSFQHVGAAAAASAVVWALSGLAAPDGPAAPTDAGTKGPEHAILRRSEPSTPDGGAFAEVLGEPPGVDTLGDVEPSAPARKLVSDGEKLYAKHLCSVCHSNDGAPRAAPTFKGLYGRDETLRDGAVVSVDAAYIRESILNPAAKITAGFQPVMPAYTGRLTDAEIAALTAYIQSLR